MRTPPGFVERWAAPRRRLRMSAKLGKARPDCKTADLFERPEQFRRLPLLGAERYEIGDLGTIRYSNGKVRPLKPSLARGQKYPSISYRSTVDGRRRTVRVHVCVALAWHGPRPSLRAIVEHADDNVMNWRADNLCWSTHRQNTRTAQRNGRALGVGIEAAKAIRDAYKPTRGRIKALREAFGISNGALRLILRGVSYAELGGPVPGYPRRVRT
jgi:hypothetical protein